MDELRGIYAALCAKYAEHAETEEAGKKKLITCGVSGGSSVRGSRSVYFMT